MWKNCCIILVVICLSITYFIFHKMPFTSEFAKTSATKIIPITTPKGIIMTEVPDTLSKYALGLGGRDTLSHGKGMLFRFAFAGKQPMWMKGMRFPIDIIWLNKHKQVIYLKASISPNTYTENHPITYSSPEPNAQYVLELPAGDAEKWGITIGSTLSF